MIPRMQSLSEAASLVANDGSSSVVTHIELETRSEHELVLEATHTAGYVAYTHTDLSTPRVTSSKVNAQKESSPSTLVEHLPLLTDALVVDSVAKDAIEESSGEGCASVIDRNAPFASHVSEIETPYDVLGRKATTSPVKQLLPMPTMDGTCDPSIAIEQTKTISPNEVRDITPTELGKQTPLVIAAGVQGGDAEAGDFDPEEVPGTLQGKDSTPVEVPKHTTPPVVQADIVDGALVDDPVSEEVVGTQEGEDTITANQAKESPLSIANVAKTKLNVNLQKPREDVELPKHAQAEMAKTNVAAIKDAVSKSTKTSVKRTLRSTSKTPALSAKSRPPTKKQKGSLSKPPAKGSPSKLPAKQTQASLGTKKTPSPTTTKRNELRLMFHQKHSRKTWKT